MLKAVKIRPHAKTQISPRKAFKQMVSVAIFAALREIRLFFLECVQMEILQKNLDFQTSV